MLMKGTRRPGPRCRPRAPNPGRAAEDARGDAHGLAALSAGTGRRGPVRAPVLTRGRRQRPRPRDRTEPRNSGDALKLQNSES